MAESNTARCQQLLRVETRYWQETPECGKAARFTWVSDLRGKLKLCRRHAKAIGLERCTPITIRRQNSEGREEHE